MKTYKVIIINQFGGKSWTEIQGENIVIAIMRSLPKEEWSRVISVEMVIDQLRTG